MSRKQEEYVEQNREAIAQLNDEVFGVHRRDPGGGPIVDGTSRSNSFEKKKTSVYPKQNKIASIQYSLDL